MDCRWVQGKLSNRLSQWLTAKERARAEAHLADCATCRRVDEELRLAVASLREFPMPQTSDRFLANLRAALPSQRLPWWRVAWRGGFGFRPTFAARRLAFVSAMTCVLLITGTTGVIQQHAAVRRGDAYLALCAERHELIAVHVDSDAGLLEGEHEG